MMTFIKQLTGLCLIRLVMDFILPEGDSSQYAVLGVELCMMLCMLHGIFQAAGGILR